MPESKSRKKKTVVARPQDAGDQPAKIPGKPQGNPPWLVPVMLGLMLLGLAWIVVYYLTSARAGGGFPVPPLGAWNLLVGFVLIIAGFALTTRWK
ncbi:cell division protein CrgA [Xylanimonas oleitrophica]|uniref:Cell division protein CrgA n=1 Tax=Xylanimonas oleitrophica TaxID=2607479 RepID=A0A2W5WQE4_9MICO|nr:cell division protein CrgA [Xylanimonas oleitrophica]PZR53172.1 cell division protein CrgA [Xylanimonas oleitrophica]